MSPDDAIKANKLNFSKKVAFTFAGVFLFLGVAGVGSHIAYQDTPSDGTKKQCLSEVFTATRTQSRLVTIDTNDINQCVEEEVAESDKRASRVMPISFGSAILMASLGLWAHREEKKLKEGPKKTSTPSPC